MRASWMICVSLVFANVVRADNPVGQDPPKAQNVEVEAVQNTTSVIVIVVDDKGNVIKKETVQIDKQGAKESPKTFQFDTKDGKLKIVMPDGSVKEILRRGKTLPRDGVVDGIVTIDVIRLETAATEAAAEVELAVAQLDEAKGGIRDELEKVIQEMELSAKLNVDDITNQVEAAMKQLEGVKAGIKGEMVVKFGDLDVIELRGDANGKVGDNVVIGQNVVAGENIAVLRKDKGKIRVARVAEKADADDSVLNKIMKKLDQLSTRLDKIEAKLEKSNE